MIQINQNEPTEHYFSAETIYHQFLAVALFIKQYALIDEVVKLPYLSRIKKAKHLDITVVKKRLINGWNTEKILITNKQLLLNDDNYFVLQWAFPQAYYSVFSTTLAYFNSVGFTEESHTNVLRKVGEIMNQGYYPAFLSFYCNGTKKNTSYKNIQLHKDISHWGVRLYDNASVENKICQLLRTTRSQQLDDKREDLKKNFTNNKNLPKLKLTEQDWEKVSEKTGYTTIFNYLYRKRIKSNYQDVEVFGYEGIKSSQINNCLLRIVNAINLTHESFIYKAIGFENYNSIYESFYQGKNEEFLEKRFKLINNHL